MKKLATFLLALTTVSCFSSKSVTSIPPPVQQNLDEATISRLLQVKKGTDAAPETGLWAPLYKLKSSPDGKSTVWLEGLNKDLFDQSSFHALNVRQGSNEGLVLFTVWDADPGSGPAIFGRWTADSKALRLQVKTLGFDYDNRSPRWQHREYDFIYLVDEGKLYATP